ncbi:MAG: acetyl-CoA carboxylase carboxyltransferase subunit alpha [Candidatus Eisenbacteria bacterium]|uniref:Acetyl-coenzyme A carboxylase carboxyl transferase subunit alpha n=1 Tax=Eiseniibacteriota bacterium TaxID=2212470 RepID=A0A948RV38_UNCEI|nr:acetyl-CoA carboxylase carboxyltransferase subunit alpha [Candidatus Eisenbacteria bacterium]MBU1950193.1 acetyl-CoA carboxylase carboxyltransferase subunit alpha [Candidatus Eisenbacteria bacterium]MBU2691410.1 acetyl-CoA carboxylase carboxyltransferase subunit alpha [Candidatus Eisenbacteria bacterium]
MTAGEKPKSSHSTPRPGDLGWLEFEKPILELERRIEDLRAFANQESIEVSDELKRLERKVDRLRKDIYSSLTRWQRVQLARHPRRPFTLDYIKRLFTDFVELHGDRLFRDDRAIVCGWARFQGEPVIVLGQQKGRNMKENLLYNFGMPHPEGYRKALRLMKMAAKFRIPIITLIDTPGAYPGIGAEERGQAEAIARNILEMSRLPVPIVCAIIGEGGSGGALALAVGDEILMMENAVYSVITPEGCAAILWKDRAHANRAAEALKLTAPDLMKFGIIDAIVPEPLGGAHRDPDAVAADLGRMIAASLSRLKALDPETLFHKRQEKFLAMGVVEEV